MVCMWRYTGEVKRVGPNYKHANFPLPTPIHRAPTKQKVYLFTVNSHCPCNTLLGLALYAEHLQLVLVLGVMLTLMALVGKAIPLKARCVPEGG